MKSLMCVIVLYFIPSISPHDIMHCQFPLHYLFFSSKKKKIPKRSLLPNVAVLGTLSNWEISLV